MTITLCNGKGGAGKTTLTMMLALAFAKAGRRVGVSDRDPQGTASLWLAKLVDDRQRDGKPIDDLPTAATGQGSHDVVIIDTPPRLEAPQVKDAIREADKVILVSSPSPADRWTTAKSATLILSYLTKKQRARLLFNQVQPGTLLSQELDSLAKGIGMPALFNIVRRRQAYQHAAVLGWAGLNTRAQEEILMLTQEIDSL